MKRQPTLIKVPYEEYMKAVKMQYEFKVQGHRVPLWKCMKAESPSKRNDWPRFGL